jgi:hypothetical protein
MASRATNDVCFRILSALVSRTGKGRVIEAVDICSM